MSKQTDLINIPDAITVSGSNVGIGETVPLGKLHIKTADSGATVDVGADELVIEGSGNAGMSILSGASNTGSIYFGDSGTNWDGYIAYSQNSRSMTFGTAAGGGSMTLDSSGNVGIGAAPSTHLTAGYNLRLDGGAQTYLAFNNDTHTTQVLGGFVIGNDNSAARITQRENQPIIFATNDTTRMTIDNSGRVTTPSQPSFRAFKTSSQTAGSANETVTWNATYYNVGNHFNTTSGTFTAPVAGVYQFALTCLTPNAANTLNIHITLNGSNNNGVRMRVAQANGHTTGCVTGVLNLNASDYVRVTLENQGGQLYGDASQSWTTFSGHLLG